eukprot:715076-Pelagomonas_calceolata.AAC.5
MSDIFSVEAVHVPLLPSGVKPAVTHAVVHTHESMFWQCTQGQTNELLGTGDPKPQDSLLRSAQNKCIG